MFEVFCVVALCILLALTPFQKDITYWIDAKIDEFRRKKGNK